MPVVHGAVTVSRGRSFVIAGEMQRARGLVRIERLTSLQSRNPTLKRRSRRHPSPLPRSLSLCLASCPGITLRKVPRDPKEHLPLQQHVDFPWTDAAADRFADIKYGAALPTDNSRACVNSLDQSLENVLTAEREFFSFAGWKVPSTRAVDLMNQSALSLGKLALQTPKA